MFSKILIANRGEIAIRVMRTARRMGIATVAVYCDADRDALHVETADEAVNIGPPPAASSYLVIDRIVDACRKTGADAVHPGYGFLSERAAFAEALTAAGIAFIGPNPAAIAAMGDKIESKKLAAAAGVSTIPGHLGTIGTPGEGLRVAGEIGLPVMIKASAGGGGKGMRIAWTAEEVKDGLRAAESEARAAFGDERVFIEKYIERPRHVEIQVLGDRHGNIIHLGERECSIQRRNQKIVEEAPSPAVDAALRAEMGGQAVALARAVGYDSAGTVEFILAPDRRFYFLEMNTRIQVEHPVTELTTGIDLVEQMIRIAAGEPLDIGQEDIRQSGWAIEARLYAEDPFHDFLPSVGRLERYRPPPEGRQSTASVRVDSGVAEGSEVSIYFDPLIAKLIVHAPDRAAATDAMAAALDRFVVDGIAHNQPFLSALIQLPRWCKGELSTSFITEEFPGGFEGRKPAKEEVSRLSMIVLAVDLQRRARLTQLRGRLDRTAAAASGWMVGIGEAIVPLQVVGRPVFSPTRIEMLSSALEGPVAVVSDWTPGEPVWAGRVGDHALSVQVRPMAAGLRLSWRGIDLTARVMTPRVAELEALMPAKVAAGQSKALRCPMPGLLLAVEVEKGRRVGPGQPLAVVEAMKMQNVLRAERDGTIARIVAEPGDILAVGDVILEFE